MAGAGPVWEQRSIVGDIGSSGCPWDEAFHTGYPRGRVLGQLQASREGARHQGVSLPPTLVALGPPASLQWPEPKPWALARCPLLTNRFVKGKQSPLWASLLLMGTVSGNRLRPGDTQAFSEPARFRKTSFWVHCPSGSLPARPCDSFRPSLAITHQGQGGAGTEGMKGPTAFGNGRQRPGFHGGKLAPPRGRHLD